MSFFSLYTDLQADSIRIPPSSLELQDSNSHLVLTDAAVNLPVIDIDGRAALLSCNQPVCVFRQVIHPRLISTEDFVRSVYIDQFVRPPMYFL